MLGEYEVMFSPAHVFSSVALVPTTAHLLNKQVGDCTGPPPPLRESAAAAAAACTLPCVYVRVCDLHVK